MRRRRCRLVSFSVSLSRSLSISLSDCAWADQGAGSREKLVRLRKKFSLHLSSVPHCTPHVAAWLSLVSVPPSVCLSAWLSDCLCLCLLGQLPSPFLPLPANAHASIDQKRQHFPIATAEGSVQSCDTQR